MRNVINVALGLLLGLPLAIGALALTGIGDTVAAGSSCPTPQEVIGLIPDGRVPLEEQQRGWLEAKRLVRLWDERAYEVIKDWDAVLPAYRFNQYFNGDPDGPGPLLNSEFVGFHVGPNPFVEPKTGKILACEYIFIFLPEEAESLLTAALAHEYLHALFFRLFGPVGGSEQWVHELMGER